MSHSSAVEEYIQYATQITASCANRPCNGLRAFLYAVMDAQDFQVTLEQLAEVLRQTECSLGRRLRTPDFEEGTDYRIEPSGVGERKQRVLLTVDAFKQLALTARGKRALEVREYIVEAESALRERMTEQIQDRRLADPEELTEQKEREFREPVPHYPLGACVYVLRVEYDADDTGAAEQVVYKIGRTMNLSRHLTKLRRVLPGRVTLVGHRMFDDHEFLEVCVHTLLKNFRLTKAEESTELFDAEPDEVFAALETCHAGWRKMQAQFESRDE